ncbi:MAG: tail fiber domain-containing protein [Verrucomicrobiales bacterium]|nr:tail fiber domain-containing protein [Verrucomicrobiales bacterium]
MKTKTLSLSVAALAVLPGLLLAQGTYLSDPNDNSNHALVVAPGGNIGIGTSNPTTHLTVVDALGLTQPSWGAAHWRLEVGNNPQGRSSPRSLSVYPDFFGDGGDVNIIPTPTSNPFGWTVFKANGNVGIGTTTPQAKLDVAGKINCTVIELTSDRNQKQDFVAVDARRVLDRLVALPIMTWAFTNDSKVRHMGAVAQDWKAAFPEFGSDDKHIGAGDISGVALAAIQGLNEKLAESPKRKDAELAKLEQRLARMEALAARLARLEMLMAQNPSHAPGATHSQNVNFSLSTPYAETQ